MTIDSFSRQISSYIDYKTVVQAVNDLNNSKHTAMEKSVLLLGSETIHKAEDWDLYNLVRDFLSKFKIPKETLELLVNTNDNLSMDDDAIQWLLNYRFTGELKGNPKLHERPSNLSFKPLIAIIAESSILDILYYPVNFLINSVEVLSINWQEMKQLNARAYLEPGTASELLVYIEKRIASHYKNLEKFDAGEKAGNSPYNGYRYWCLTSELPIDIQNLKLAQELSLKQALSTIL
ncbi:hypothetical protein [Rufibacter tibetensis]|uniref:Uncharacterized protein n=1 Tax=Rufibacter tibetensis TaxID=512763 RepID=A0A0P0C198_9BACT|nr:hypothetical protein [Rufibacter tibetensis]ALI98583.1 hypothetical protein DC20_05865 [Rufibacter tibetensis]